jgi:hypothetical protein
VSVRRCQTALVVADATDGSVWISASDKGVIRVKEQKVETIDSSAGGRMWGSVMTEDKRGTVWYVRGCHLDRIGKRNNVGASLAFVIVPAFVQTG